MTAPCEWCMSPFTKSKSTHRFCRRKCAQRFYLKANIQRRRDRDGLQGPERTCHHCQISYVGRCGQKYCTRECYVLEQKARRKLPNRHCPLCGTEFVVTRWDKQCCSKLCSTKFARRRRKALRPPVAQVPCSGCRQLFTPIHKRHQCCSPPCAKQVYDTNYRRSRRSRLRGVETDGVGLAEVYFRDKGICQHCKKVVDLRWHFPDPRSASHDHIIPLHRGGTDTFANSQLAHLGCNLAKGAGTLPQGEQLRVIG